MAFVTDFSCSKALGILRDALNMYWLTTYYLDILRNKPRGSYHQLLSTSHLMAESATHVGCIALANTL
eukprot:scaffold11257_cov513-Chaetoceros_neogracile.AAC.1